MTSSKGRMTSLGKAMTQQTSKMSFFGGNAFATPVGQKIEQATAETLPSEDWGLNLEVCDLVNESEDGPRDAIKAIRKRLTTHPKNYTVVMYTLTVLETCVKNCGKKFHVHACTKDFVQELVKLIGPKNEPPAAVQEKVLSLIQSWADAFRHQPELSGVSQVYAELKHKGVEFPAGSMETMAPIITPQRTSSVAATEPRPISRPPTAASMMAISPRHRATHHPPPPASTPPANPAALTAEQKAKLHSELDVVESNAKVMAEMLAELSPGREHHEDLQLLQELHATCRAMQQRVVDLVGRVNDDLLTADLLRINDNLNNLFIRYDRYMSKVKSSGSPSKSPPQTQPAPPAGAAAAAPQPPPEVSLIDLADDDTPSTQLASLSVGASPQKTKKNEDADFDMFAQSRTATSDNTKTSILMDNTAAADTTTTTTTTSTTTPGQTTQVKQNAQQKDSDFEEMEAWLNEQPVPTPREETISSSDFDRFLEERAAAADNLPTIPAATGSSSAPRQQRTLARDDKDTNQMFAL